MTQLFLADIFIFQCGIILLVLGSMALFVCLFPHIIPLGIEEKERKHGACSPRSALDVSNDRMIADVIVANAFQQENESYLKCVGHSSVKRVASHLHGIDRGHRSKKPPWRQHDSISSDAGWIQSFPLPPNRNEVSSVTLDFGMTRLVEQPDARWRYDTSARNAQDLHVERSGGISRHTARELRDR
ncbi:hypothetical protein TGME49_214550 [Toxoplasma gondii ME49]|uniref:Transmembrane protein n=2 Tax=Toxoplasma gondii TaxID=5811 RepID=S8ESZ6_TOXGM|nr:hypothetical protein TGME49_214550 [Toxoplasma gondii ME49]EPT26531.1 hypothetical protein TGME49_214550 [Toxoplasma gondii ME49]KFG35952.1 putative transmembrane protein [Toxoplasma gondii GAB2-2007-GAL-DOM2]|eukprot:XP_002370786.1 hypothetical protein TGME49_214550 [Toxoplasma gondii ME49]